MPNKYLECHEFDPNKDNFESCKGVLMNKILAVYLKRIINQLSNAIDETDESIGDRLERENERHYTGKPNDILGPMFPESYELKPTGDVIALSPLNNLYESLQGDYKLLISDEGEDT